MIGAKPPLSTWTRDELEAHLHLLEMDLQHTRAASLSVHLRDVDLDSDFLFFSRHFPQMEDVLLTNCVVTKTALQSIAALPRLRRLAIEEANRLVEVSALDQIRSTSRSLRELRISHCGLGCDGAAHVANVLPAGFEQLESLCLSHSCIGLAGASSLSSHLPDVRKTLTCLDLGHNSLSDEGCMVLAAGLEQLLHLRRMDLSNNAIGPRGACALASKLSSANELEELDLANNPIHDAGGAAIGELLVSQRVPKLRRLDLSYGRIGAKSAAIVAAGLAHCRLMEELQLTCCMMGSAGAAALAKSLGALTCLRILGLSENLIESDGARSLAALAMPFLSRLECLDLGRNGIGDLGAADVAKSLSSMPNLRTLNLTSNSIGDDGAVALSHPIRSLSHLEELFIGDNYVISESALALAPSLQSLSVLRTLDVFRNWVGDAGMKALLEALPLSVKRLDVSDNRCSAEGAGRVAALVAGRGGDDFVVKCDELGDRAAIEAASQSPARHR